MKHLGKTLIIGLLSLGALASCAQGQGSSNDGDSSVAEGRVIQHIYGETRLSSAPQRVVSLGWNAFDSCLALGVVPVGGSKVTYGVGYNEGESGMRPWTEAAISDLNGATPTIIDDVNGVSSSVIEQVAALNPDLILAIYSNIDKNTYDQLSAIAPTIPYIERPYSTNWRDQLRVTAKALFLEDEGEQVISDTEKFISDTTANYQDLKGKKAAYTWFIPSDMSQFYVYIPGDPRVDYLNDMGFVTPDSVTQLGQGQTNFFVTVSAEQATLLNDADIIVNYGVPGTIASIQQDPLLGQISAIKDGKAIDIDQSTLLGSAFDATPLSIKAQLKNLLDAIEAVNA